jgi:2-oxoglutarate dehydrogenase E1 component
LDAQRTKLGAKDIAIVRVEQLAPFPFRSVTRVLEKYPNAEVMWTQEEPKNQGAWSFVEPRMRNLMRTIKRKNVNIGYAGRDISASTATGYSKHHVKELEHLLKTTFA